MIVIILFFCCITNNHKFSSLIQHLLLSHNFCRSEVQQNMTEFSLWGFISQKQGIDRAAFLAEG